MVDNFVLFSTESKSLTKDNIKEIEEVIIRLFGTINVILSIDVYLDKVRIIAEISKDTIDKLNSEIVWYDFGLTQPEKFEGKEQLEHIQNIRSKINKLTMESEIPLWYLIHKKAFNARTLYEKEDFVRFVNSVPLFDYKEYALKYIKENHI